MRFVFINPSNLPLRKGGVPPMAAFPSLKKGKEKLPLWKRGAGGI